VIADQTAASKRTSTNVSNAATASLRWKFETLIFWAIVFSINIWLIYRGISKGIEKFCSWAMPAMAACAMIVLIRVLTLGTPDPSLPEQNVVNGLGYMWNPDFSALGNAQTWLAAAGQIFFSLSVGFGVILNYASYMKRNDVASEVTASAITGCSRSAGSSRSPRRSFPGAWVPPRRQTARSASVQRAGRLRPMGSFGNTSARRGS
jgi:SNF family Na+-dependent transporter